MTIFSLILVLYLGYLSINIKNKENFFIKVITLYFIFRIFINIGYFLKINEYLVNYFDVIFMYIVIMSYILFGDKVKIKKTYLLSILLFNLMVFFGIFLLIFSPPNFKIVSTYIGVAEIIRVYPQLNFVVAKRFMLVVLFSLFIIIFKSVIDNNRWEKIINNLILFSKVYIIFCYFELICKEIFNSNKLIILSSDIFGINVSQHIDLFKRSGHYALQGLTREPSQLAIAIFVSIYILLLSKRKDSEKIFYLILGSFLLFMSGSVSGFMVIFILIIIFFLTINKPKKIFIYGIIAFGLILFLINYIDFSYYLLRINRVLDNKESRFITIIDNFQVFLKSPIFGTGIGTTESFGFVSSALSNIGLVAFLIWGYIIFYGTKIFNLRHLIILLMVVGFYVIRGSIQDLYSGIILIFIYTPHYFFEKEDYNYNHIEINAKVESISKN